MHRLSSMASPPCHRWAPALARRVLRLTPLPPNSPPVRRVSRFPHGSGNMASSTSGEKVVESGKPDRRLRFPFIDRRSASEDTFYSKMEAFKADCKAQRAALVNVNYGDEDGCATTSEVVDGKNDARGNNVDISVHLKNVATSGCEEDTGSAAMGHRGEIVVSDDEKEDAPTDKNRDASLNAQIHPRYLVDDELSTDILRESRHRDGSMYKATNCWKEFYDIVNRNETRLEAMMLSDPTDCYISDGICIIHPACGMLQIFSVKLAKLYLDGGSVELYGYIAARDALDALLNYVVNVSRDDPIVVEQGSFINMAGPKRGIDLTDNTLIEFDMRIKTGEQEKDDLQLIDGASELNGVPLPDRCTWTERIHGDYGAIELTAAYLEDAVEATVQVLVSEVRSNFNLCLSCFIRGLDEELRLFDGSIGEPCGLKRFVVAVTQLSWMDLKLKVGAESSGSTEHCCSFKSYYHGHATQEIKTDFGLISVKVTWSTLNIEVP